MRAIPPRIPPQTDPNQAQAEPYKDSEPASEPPLARRPCVARSARDARDIIRRSTIILRLKRNFTQARGIVSVSSAHQHQCQRLSRRPVARRPPAARAPVSRMRPYVRSALHLHLHHRHTYGLSYIFIYIHSFSTRNSVKKKIER